MTDDPYKVPIAPSPEDARRYPDIFGPRRPYLFEGLDLGTADSFQYSATAEHFRLMAESPSCAGFTKSGTRGWGGPGRGWIDPRRERKGRLHHRRPAKSWSPKFAAKVAHRRIMARFRGWGPSGDAFEQRMLRQSVIGAMLRAYIDMPPPTPPTWREKLRRRFRERVVQPVRSALYAVASCLERWADNL